MFSYFFLQKSFRYGIMWKNILQPYRPQVKIRRMHLACKISTATNTNSEYVTLLSFAWQQWLRDRASVLLYTYIAFLLTSYITLCLTKWCVPFSVLLVYCISSYIIHYAVFNKMVCTIPSTTCILHFFLHHTLRCV